MQRLEPSGQGRHASAGTHTPHSTARAAHTHASCQVAANEIEDLDIDFADLPKETQQFESNTDDFRTDLRSIMAVLFIVVQKVQVADSDISKASQQSANPACMMRGGMIGW